MATREGHRVKKVRKWAWGTFEWLVEAEGQYQLICARSDTSDTPLARRTALRLGFVGRPTGVPQSWMIRQ